MYYSTSVDGGEVEISCGRRLRDMVYIDSSVCVSFSSGVNEPEHAKQIVVSQVPANVNHLMATVKSGNVTIEGFDLWSSLPENRMKVPIAKSCKR